MKTLQVGEIVGDYAVIGIAGSGGMGVVYKIEHVITRRIEAMKLLPAGLSIDPEQVHRFEREIQVQARLHHPNIVALYNAIRDGDSIALVMEFVEGDSLQRMIAAGPLPVETAVNFAIQVLGALAYAHEAGVVHRDVSPANIIITPDRVAKLSDFGLALGATDLRLSTTGVALGSPWYMSPEQIRGLEKLDARTDLYALGAVLHEMLTGRKMFEAEGSFAVMRAHVEAVPQAPSSVNPTVPPALDAIVSKAVAKDPAMRFQSADEFRTALERGALEAIGILEPSIPRKARFAGVHVSRSAALMMLVPTVLAAGFYAARIAAPAKHAPRRQNTSGAVANPERDTERPSPVVPVSTAPEVPAAPAVAGVAPAEVGAATEVSASRARPRVKSPARALRRTGQTEQSTALRITGGELPPAAPAPVLMPAPRRATEEGGDAPETAAPTANSVPAPETPEPVAAAAPPVPAAMPQVDPPANPQNGGNRFVRALGKVNPFRRSKKTDPVKDPVKPDPFRPE